MSSEIGIMPTLGQSSVLMIIPPVWPEVYGSIKVQVNITLRELLESFKAVDGSNQTYRVYYVDSTLNEVDYTDLNLDEMLKPNSEVEVRSEDGSANEFYFIEPAIIVNHNF